MAAAVDSQVFDEFAIHPGRSRTRRSILDHIAFRNSLNERPLLHAVAAPDSAVDQNLHLPLEASKQLLLRGYQLRELIHLGPSTLLLFGTGRKILLVWMCRGKLFGEVGMLSRLVLPLLCSLSWMMSRKRLHHDPEFEELSTRTHPRIIAASLQPAVR